MRRPRELLAASGLLACLLLVACNEVDASTGARPPVDVQAVQASGETRPVAHDGDAADDPAIWVDPQDPADSLVIGNDKGSGDPGALESYDLDGKLVQRITDPEGFWGNVDVRQDVSIRGVPSDVVAVVRGGLRLYTVNDKTRQMSSIADDEGYVETWGEGLCLYNSAETHRLYAFVITRAGHVFQFELLDDDEDGKLEGERVRDFDLGSEAEGCVADDETGFLYVAQEDVALWRYSAEPKTGTSRTQIDTIETSGGRLTPDIEGVTLTTGPGPGYVIVSAQNVADRAASSFAIYRRDGSNDYAGSIRVTAGSGADDCDGTDGLTAYSGDLGTTYPDGLFVCQDNDNSDPGSTGNQNFKYADLGEILPPPDAG